MQQNSLEHQQNNCKNTAQARKLEIIDEIVESKSAKDEFTREWFNQLITYCKTWKIDYIIIDEPKRLSRNTIDTSRVIDLMDKNLIKWLLATGRQYMSNNSRDKFLLQLDLSISKMDNEDRSKDVKAKMISVLKKWRYTWKAPLWYKNVWTKWNKEIIVDNDNNHYVKAIFKLRSEWYSYKDIWEKMFKIWLKWRTWKTLPPSAIEKIIHNQFYIWIMKFAWEIYKHKYKTFIDIEDFEEVNEVRWYTPVINEREKFPLKWILVDLETWKPLIASESKWHIYYKTHSRAKHKINISQRKIIELFDKQIVKYSLSETLRPYVIKWLKEYYWTLLGVSKQETTAFKNKLKSLSTRKERILNLYCDEKISDEDYKRKINELELDNVKLSKKLNDIMDIENIILEDSTKVVQLLLNLNSVRKHSTYEQKGVILQVILVQLSVDTKKQLYIQEKELFEIIKVGNFSNGGA